MNELKQKKEFKTKGQNKVVLHNVMKMYKV